jgi:hypothetical protein
MRYRSNSQYRYDSEIRTPIDIGTDVRFWRINNVVLLRMDCPEHGFAALSLPLTTVKCRICGRRLFASVVELTFADPSSIRPIE